MKLVDLQPLLPANTIFDLRYATTNNIVGKALYDNPTAWLDEPAAISLVQAAALFGRHDLRLVIWDVYRSREAHKQLLAVSNDPRYVRDDSNHLKGLAVDLTLANLDGEYIDMGTDFDDFSPKAHVDAEGLTPEQVANRKLFNDIMSSAGFEQWPYEWWHSDFLGESK